MSDKTVMFAISLPKVWSQDECDDFIVSYISIAEIIRNRYDIDIFESEFEIAFNSNADEIIKAVRDSMAKDDPSMGINAMLEVALELLYVHALHKYTLDRYKINLAQEYYGIPIRENLQLFRQALRELSNSHASAEDGYKLVMKYVNSYYQNQGKEGHA